MSDRSLEALATDAVTGDASAMEAVLAGVRDDVYGLALKMLWHPEDAADATQDVLIKVMTRLGTYRGEAALRTWVFRIAANHLLTVRRSRMERQALSFAAFAADLLDGLCGVSGGGDEVGAGDGAEGGGDEHGADGASTALGSEEVGAGVAGLQVGGGPGPVHEQEQHE